MSYLGSANVAIGCTPGANGLRTATLSFTTNDPDHASVSFNLQCTGQTPVAAGFGSTPNAPGPIQESTVVGTNDPFYLTVRETGNAQLTLSVASFVSTPPGAITLDTSFPLAINNGGAQQVIQFTCVAGSIGLKTAAFSFTTNDPAHPTVTYNLNCTVTKPKDKFIASHQSTQRQPRLVWPGRMVSPSVPMANTSMWPTRAIARSSRTRSNRLHPALVGRLSQQRARR